MDNVLLGKRIQTCRLRKGLTQGRLASIAGISEKHLSKIELGKINCRVDTLIKLADALDTSIGMLLKGFTEDKGDLYLLEISRYISDFSLEEKARLLWHIQMEKKFEMHKDNQMFFAVEEE